MKYLIISFLFMGCSSKPCREVNSAELTKTVQVYKYDGTLQCGMGTEITLEQMEKELKDIKVISKQKKRDGMIRTAVCGAGTGQANVYEISLEKQKDAEKLGFKIWNF